MQREKINILDGKTETDKCPALLLPAENVRLMCMQLSKALDGFCSNQLSLTKIATAISAWS